MKNKKWVTIENIMQSLKEEYDPKKGISAMQTMVDLSQALKSLFPQYTFEIKMTYNENRKTPFIMSVYPNVSTIDKIINALMDEQDNHGLVAELWKKNKIWTIEIDSSILNDENFDFSPQELTALLIHEIGHVILSNDVVTRLSTILQFTVAKASIEDKMTLRHKLFRKLLSIPILDACVRDKSESSTSIKEEIKADNFAKKNGYEKELYSALTKTYEGLKKNKSFNDSVGSSADFSIQLLNDLKERRNKLVKSNMLSLIESCESPFASAALQSIYNEFFDDTEEEYKFSKLYQIQEEVDKLINESYMTEFFSFGKNTLTRIDPADFDYIIVRSQNMRTERDKLLLLGYIHSKMDIIDYYISILNDPKASKRYRVPHTIDELERFKKILNQRREFIIQEKLPEKHDRFLVKWPEGYEG